MFRMATEATTSRPSCSGRNRLAVSCSSRRSEPVGRDRRGDAVRVPESAGAGQAGRAARGNYGPALRALERLGHRPGLGRLAPRSPRPFRALALLAIPYAQVRRTVDAVLDTAEAASVRVRALPSRQYDDTNWWTSRRGFREFGGSWLMRVQNWLGESDAARPPERAPTSTSAIFYRHCRRKRHEAAAALACRGAHRRGRRGAMLGEPFPVVARAAAGWLDVGQRPRRADYVMVLNGGEDTRPFAAAALITAGWALALVVGGCANARRARRNLAALS